MATSDNVTTLLQIDAGEAFTKMKQYKEYMDNLRAALMGLEKGSEDYNAVLSKLNETQEKYAEVMDVSKGKNTEAADSYNALNKQLVELRKSYRNLSEDARNSPVGVAMLEGIKNLDSQLKDMDAAMGQYFRNVGDYRNAFIESFDKMLGPLGKVGGGFGKILQEVKGMIPVIKNATTSATKGLSGIKAAIASTGIGVLVIAVGELAAHWEDIYNWVTGVDDVTKDLEDTQKKMTDSVDTATKNIGYQLQIRRAQGQTEVQLLEFQQKALITEYARLKVYKELLQTKYEELEAHSILTKLSNGEYQIMEAIKKNIDETDEKMGKLWDDIVGLGVSLKAAKIKEKADELKDMAAKSKSAAQELEKMKEAAKKFVQAINDESLSDSDKLKKNYEDRLATLQGYYDAGLIKEEEYQRTKALIEKKYIKDTYELRKAAQEKADNELIASVQKSLDASLKEIDKELSNRKFDIKIDFDLQKLNPANSGTWFENLLGIKGRQTILDEVQQKIQNISDNANAELDASKRKVAQLKLAMSELTEGSDEYLKLQQQITEELEKQGRITKQAAADIAEANKAGEDALADEQVQMWSKISNGIQQCSALLTQYASYQQSVIQQDVQDGKISEEQAKKRFKNIKALQYGSIIMNTAAGSIIAMVTSIRDLGMPWGAVVGGIQAAAITASGAIQAATVAKQKFGSVNGNSLSTPNMSPITNTYVPQYTANVQTNTELTELANAMGNISPVVRVTDINDVQNTVKVRQEENTF